MKTKGETNRNYYFEYEEHSIEELLEDFKVMIKTAEGQGYTDCKIVFRSTLEPYEDNMPGPVEVCVSGMRDKTEEELNEEKRREEVQAFATEKGITYYEANILMDLQKRGKV